MYIWPLVLFGPFSTLHGHRDDLRRLTGRAQPLHVVFGKHSEEALERLRSALARREIQRSVRTCVRARAHAYCACVPGTALPCLPPPCPPGGRSSSRRRMGCSRTGRRSSMARTDKTGSREASQGKAQPWHRWRTTCRGQLLPKVDLSVRSTDSAYVCVGCLLGGALKPCAQKLTMLGRRDNPPRGPRTQPHSPVVDTGAAFMDPPLSRRSALMLLVTTPVWSIMDMALAVPG